MPLSKLVLSRIVGLCLGVLGGSQAVFSAPADTILIARGSAAVWKYLDDGTDPGTAWRAGEFDDGAWKQGTAPLGYGEPDLATVIGFGGKAQRKHMTAYFRRTFDVAAAPAARRLALLLRIDDGAVVYLNGEEIARVNMPAGVIRPNTPSQRPIAGVEETRYGRHLAPVKGLVPGHNVLAVEVHQCEPASSDLIFDLELMLVPDPPVARVTPASRDVSLLYLTKHYIPPGQRIPDGYVDGGRGMKIGNDGVVWSRREVIVVDRTRDALLRQHLDYARSPWLAALPTMERAKLLALYTDQVCSPPDSRVAAWSNVEEIESVYEGREFMFGQLVSSGVCRHRALLFKLLGDEAGLSVALVRGNATGGDGTAGHAWNELVTDDGEKLIVDVAGPRPGFRFPATTEPSARAYLTVDNRPYYAENAAAPAAVPPTAKVAPAPGRIPDDPDGRALVQTAWQAVAEYHRGSAGSRSTVRVVYFHPADRDPLPDYAARLDRIMTDVGNFYRDGLRRFGIENEGLPLERKDGRLVLHLVRGKLPASGYNYESGGETAQEARAALKGVVDFDREHVLMVYGLCRKEPDGRYVFDAPYYGTATKGRGCATRPIVSCSIRRGSPTPKTKSSTPSTTIRAWNRRWRPSTVGTSAAWRMSWGMASACRMMPDSERRPGSGHR